MGVYIKGLKMPPSGQYAFVLTSSGMVENVNGLVVGEAVEVKAPHGRLIDAKAFETKNKYFWHRDFINAKSEDALCDLFDDAPTIIEAEG